MEQQYQLSKKQKLILENFILEKKKENPKKFLTIQDLSGDTWLRLVQEKDSPILFKMVDEFIQKNSMNHFKFSKV